MHKIQVSLIENRKQAILTVTVEDSRSQPGTRYTWQ